MTASSAASAGRTEMLSVAGCLTAALPLLLPFAILICDWRWELVATATCMAALLLPGLLLAHVWFAPGHPLARPYARFSTALVLSLLLFGLVGTVATKLHWTFATFRAVYIVVYLLVAGASAAALIGRARRSAARPEEWPALILPSSYRRWAGIVLLAGVAVAMVGLCLGHDTAARPWWHWSVVGLVGGVATLVVLALARSTAATQGGQTGGAGEARRTHESPGPTLERILVVLLWVSAGLITAYLMKAAYEWPLWDKDDVTYVSRAVDFLTGEPMDCYEPSLGEPIPLAPGFVLATVSLLGATMQWATGVHCAALMHGTLPPLIVLAGVSSLAAALTVVLRRARLFVPLGLLIALGVLLKGADGHRDLVNFLVYRVAQPKSVHLGIVLPVQLAALLLSATYPSRRHTAFAIAVGLAGYLIHPWAVAVQLVWSATLAAVTLLTNRRGTGHLAVVVAATVLIGGLHQLDAKYDPFGVGESRAVTPTPSLDLARSGRDVRPVLDARVTIGGYTVFRLGILAIPFVLLLGFRCRECLLLGLLALPVIALAFVEPLGALYAKAMPTALLWRTRWMLTSICNAALLGVCLYWGVAIVLRRARGGTWPAASPVGTLVALAGIGGMLHFSPSKYVSCAGPVERLTKFSAITHQVAAALGGAEASPYLLAPARPEHAELAVELCQLMPRIRLILTRPHIGRWFLGTEETKRRRALLRSFYEEEMTLAQFRQLRQRFPVDHAIVDYRFGYGDRQVRMLSSLGWRRGARIEYCEIWRAPDEASPGRQPAAIP